jgi:hypothetical protein
VPKRPAIYVKTQVCLCTELARTRPEDARNPLSRKMRFSGRAGSRRTQSYAFLRKQGRAACGEKNGGRHYEMGTSIDADLGPVWAGGVCCPGTTRRGRSDRRGSASGQAWDCLAFRQGDRSGRRAMRKHDWPRVLVRAAPDHTDDGHPKGRHGQHTSCCSYCLSPTARRNWAKAVL